MCCACRYTNEFLRGTSSQLPCEAEYLQYQQCVLSKLSDDVKRELPPIDVINPGSLDGAAQSKAKAANSGNTQQKPATGNNAAS